MRDSRTLSPFASPQKINALLWAVLGCAILPCGCAPETTFGNEPEVGGSTSAGSAFGQEFAGQYPWAEKDLRAGGKVRRERIETDGGESNLKRGLGAVAAGEYDDALQDFERAIEDNPRLTTAYLGAGEIYQRQGDYAGAEDRYGRAVRLEPENFEAQYGHGLALQFLSRLSESVGAYLRALVIRPDDFSANLNLGTAYLQLGEPAQGLSFARRAVDLDSTSTAARINLGAIFSAMGRHDDAVMEYQQASELTELSAPLLLNLAESLGKTGRYGEMVNTLEQLVQAKPTAIGYERLGMGLFRMKRYPESLSAFRKAVEIDPNHFPALNGIGVCLANQYEFSGREDEMARKEAASAWRRSLQIERGQARILELLTRYQ